MRSSKTVFKRDGTPIEVVTLENEKDVHTPLGVGQENLYEVAKLVESAPQGLTPKASQSTPDK